MKMGGGPHGKYAIKAYTKRHTNTFRFNFNQRVSERRRKAQSQDSETEVVCSSEPTDDVSMVLSPGIDVGYDGTNTQCATEVAQPDDDYLYM